MLLCVAIIQKDSSRSFRVVNAHTREVKEINESSIGNNIRNLEVSNGKIIFTEGEENRYPVERPDGVSHNNPIIIKEGRNVILANYEGKIITLSEKELIQKVKTYANATINNNKIEIEYTKNKSNNSINFLDAVMQTPDRDIDIHNFDIRNHYKNLGISPNIFKKVSSMITGGQDEVKREPTIVDTNQYKFTIVKVDDRVELREYSGNGYKGKVIIPSNVTHICNSAFARAEATELEMTDSVVYLGDSAFAWSNFKDIHLSKNITAIPYECFFQASIENINLENITSIDNLAFCESNIRRAIFKAPIIQIGFEAFKDCKSLEIFEHAKTITKIRHHAFKGCISLTYFDFDSVTTIEQYAFDNTGIKKAKLNGDIGYLQASTFTGDIEEIELLEGFKKISAGAVSNINNKPIVWKMPKSAKNIEKGAFLEKDTVICYRNTIAASQAILSEAQIIYVDELDKNSIPNIIRKAKMLDTSVEDILRETLKKVLDKEQVSCEFEIDESKLVRENIPSVVLDFLPPSVSNHKYATAEDIEEELTKFKCILKHLYMTSSFDIVPFISNTLGLKDTFRVSKVETLYKDDKSSVLRIVYTDNKFTSVDSSFIIAKTYDTLRYICMDNKYTDLMCENEDLHDLTALLKILRPGDTIGLSSVISGVKYPEISAKSDKEITTTKNNVKVKTKLEMNIYQALRYSSVTVKLDNNSIALLLPGVNKIIKCASLGKTVWLNEKEETYKSLQCTIESIEDFDNNTVFNYDETHNSNNYGPLLKRFRSMNSSDYSKYIDSYSHIYEAKQSMYKMAGNYAYQHSMKTIIDADIKFMTILFKTSLFEERPESWIEKSKGKTIVKDAQHEFELSDGSTLYQYRAVRKTALRNKLMSGGDRKLYVFELVDSYGLCAGVYISLYDIITLTNMCIGINTISQEKTMLDTRVFENKDRFDVVDASSVIEVAVLCKETYLRISTDKMQFALMVFKPNGLFYIGIKIEYGKTFRFIPVIQVGEMDVALGLVEDSNKYGANNESIKYLYKASYGIVQDYITRVVARHEHIFVDKAKYLGLLQARKMCIDGVYDISAYNKLGIPEVLKRSMGYTTNMSKLYEKPALEINIDEIDESELLEGELLDGSSEAEEILQSEDNLDANRVNNLINSGISDDDFDIDESDFGDI